MSTSPDSQCIPATLTVSSAGSSARSADSAVYRASYSCGRGLSDMPPSTATQVRSGSRFTAPTR